jgi:hypothetical protein
MPQTDRLSLRFSPVHGVDSLRQRAVRRHADSAPKFMGKSVRWRTNPRPSANWWRPAETLSGRCFDCFRGGQRADSSVLIWPVWYVKYLPRGTPGTRRINNCQVHFSLCSETVRIPESRMKVSVWQFRRDTAVGQCKSRACNGIETPAVRGFLLPRRCSAPCQRRADQRVDRATRLDLIKPVFKEASARRARRASLAAPRT